MAVTATLPLLVEIGNQTPDTLYAGNDSWVDYQTSGLWGAYLFAQFERGMVVTVDDRGFLHALPDPDRASLTGLARWTAGTVEPISIIDSEIYWQWRPPEGVDNTAALYVQDFNAIFTIVIEILNGTVFIDANDATASFTYDEDQHRWWRIYEYAGEVYIQTAPSGGTWYTQVTYLNSNPAQLPFEERDALYFDFALYIDHSPVDPGHEAEGWIGPLNQLPVPRELPLLVDVGDPLVSRVIKTLPLLVDIGDVSP